MTPEDTPSSPEWFTTVSLCKLIEDITGKHVQPQSIRWAIAKGSIKAVLAPKTPISSKSIHWISETEAYRVVDLYKKGNSNHDNH